jgi:hypothetical protein
MNIPPENSEDLQILKYEVGQFYNTHHDYIPHQKDRQCGPRILTFFLYLSDVEAGGGTDFPDLGITVNPKRFVRLDGVAWKIAALTLAFLLSNDLLFRLITIFP